MLKSTLRFLFFVIVSFLSIANGVAQSPDKNYTKTTIPKIPLTNSELLTTSSSNLLENVTYVDGLGRQIQSVSMRQSPSGKDVIQHFEYDEFGRQVKQYLPLPTSQTTGNFVINPVLQINTYYQTNYNDNRPYSETRYDDSSLNRVLESSGPGQDWTLLLNSDLDHTIKNENEFNSIDELVNYQIQSDNSFVTSNYAANELFKSVIKNQNWTTIDDVLNTSEVFTDKSGKKIAEISYDLPEGETIPRKLVTQYVYDDHNRLRYILTPKFHSDTGIGSYSDYQKGWPVNDFLQSGNLLGNLIFSIQNNVLKVVVFGIVDTNTGTLNSQTQKTISTSPTSLPDMYLGKVMGISPTSGVSDFEVGEASISGGKLVIDRTSTAPFVGLNIDIEIDLLAPQTTPSNLDHLAFQYEYDEYNRQVGKKTPGRGWEYVVYDFMDRPILKQHANLAKQEQWLFSKYDALGRVIYSGIHSNGASRETLQTQVDNFINASSTNKSNTENRISGTTNISGTTINYSNVGFPNTNIISVLSVNYYDDYSFSDPDKPTTPTIGQSVTLKTKNLLTANWTRTLDNSNTWTKTYTYYDTKARAIIIHQVNHLGGSTITENYLDFRGKGDKTVTIHKRTAASSIPLTITDNFTYDHAERIAGHSQQINTQPEENIVTNTYDELGKLTGKKVGGAYSSTTPITPLQNISYAYNVRGRLNNVNDIDNLGTDLFAYQMLYNESTSGTASVDKLYNGNIKQVIWRSAIDGTKKSYAFEYDKLNRLYSSHFRENNSLSGGTGKFETYRVGYDTNGNIEVVRRNNHLGQQIDKLGYLYDDGNKLTSIGDLTQNPDGFFDGHTGSGEDYLYDDNGNLIDDRNKNIISIDYNFMDLVEEIVISRSQSVDLTYDAIGGKLSKIHKIGANPNYWTLTEYLGGFQYINGALQFFQTPEGYAYKDGNSYKYVYLYSDHIGNNRVSYSDTNGNGSLSASEVLSSTDYYPMGLIHQGEYISGFASNYKYKFQGKEHQEDFSMNMYDFGSRMYDPSVGRWFNTDPQNQFASPYLAMGNDYVNVIDPNGEFAVSGSAILAGAAIGAITGATAYAATASQTGDWNWGEFAGSVGGAALIGGISGGLAGTGSNAVVLSGKTVGNAALTGVVSSFTPSANIPIGNNFSVGVSPALAYGSSGVGIGGNLSANFRSGDFSLSYGYGATFFGKAYGTGKSGWETRESVSVGYDTKSFSARIYSTNFSSGVNNETSQRIGGLHLRANGYNLRYENDGTPFHFIGAGDGGDSYRTAALQLGYKDFSLGFSLFTGKRDFEKDTGVVGQLEIGPHGRRYPNGFVGEVGPAYRIGALYVGYKGLRYGIDSEHVRHAIQDQAIHNLKIGPIDIQQPGFENQSWGSKNYVQFQSSNPFTLW